MYGNGRRPTRFDLVVSLAERMSFLNRVRLGLVALADADQQVLAVGRDGHGRRIPAGGDEPLDLPLRLASRHR